MPHAIMPSTDALPAVAVCTNLPDCPGAVAQATIEWYPGAGEYCPECGEALTRSELAAPAAGVDALATEPAGAPAPVEPTFAGVRRPTAQPARRAARSLGILAVVLVGAAAAGYAYFSRPSAAAGPEVGSTLAICPGAGSPQLVGDLVRGYAAKTGLPTDRFAIGNVATCDVRFLPAAASSDAIIARDGIVAVVNPLNPAGRISEEQLRGIFGGSIRDWSQVGGPHEPIIALLPSDTSEDGKAIARSLFFGIPISRSVERRATSADVTRAVTGADRRSRYAIGIVAFSAAVPAKVIPLAYLPPPSALTIANRLYPYTLTIAVDIGNGRADPSAAAGFVSYARSSDGAEIVAKNGLIGRGGP